MEEKKLESDADFRNRIAESDHVNHYWAETIGNSYGSDLDEIAEILGVTPRKQNE